MYRWHAFSYEWFGTKTRFARDKSQLFIHGLLREPLISNIITNMLACEGRRIFGYKRQSEIRLRSETTNKDVLRLNLDNFVAILLSP